MMKTAFTLKYYQENIKIYDTNLIIHKENFQEF